MKKIIFILFFNFQFFFFNFSFGQPAIQWQKCLGGAGWDQAYSVQQTADGGYIVTGSADSSDGDVTGNHGLADFWVVKLDNSGNLQWQKCLGGTGGDAASSVQQTADGGYIIAGLTLSNDGDVTGYNGLEDGWIVKLASSGNLQWQKCLGGANDDYAYSAQQTIDGGYIVAGYTKSNDGDVMGNHDTTGLYWDGWIVKLDGNGNIEWQKCLGGTNHDAAYPVQQTPDGGYVVAGATHSNDGDVAGFHGTEDCWVVKLDSTGNIEWQKCLGGIGPEQGYSVQLTADGGYIVAGAAYFNDGDVTGNHGNYDYWVVKLNTAGNIQWRKCLGGTDVDIAFSVQQTSDGGYIVTGSALSNDGDVTGNHGNYDYWVVKLDGGGNIQWQKCLGGINHDNAYSIQQTTDAGYIVAGRTYSNNGDVTGSHGFVDCWLVKLSPYVDIKELASGVTFHIFPTPPFDELIIDNGELKIEGVEIYNTLGEKVYSQPQTSNLKPQTVNVSQLLAGVYFVAVTDDKGNKITRRFIKM